MSTTLSWDLVARDRASDKFDKIGGSVDKTGSKFRTLGKIAAVGTAALAAGAVVAGKAMFGMVKAAVEDEAAQDKLAVALMNNAQASSKQVAATEKWIAAQGKALGVTDDELRPALGRLVTATHDVGKAQKLASLAMDVSAGTGKSLEAVSMALMKARNGETAGLSKLGIATKDAKGETLSFRDATAKMAQTFSGHAFRSAQTLEGRTKRLKVMFDETKEAIGARLLPIAEKFADWALTKAAPAVQRFADTVGPKLVPALRDAGSALLAVGQRVMTVARFLNEHRTAATALAVTIGALVAVTKIHAAVMAVQAAGGLIKYIKATKIVTAMTKTWAAVQWVLNAALTANPIGLVVVGLAALAAGLVIAYKKSETFRNIVSKGMDKVSAAVKAIGAAGKWMWNNALQPVFKFIVVAVGKVLTWFGKMLQLMGKAPGMGWIGTLGDKLVGAGGKALGLADRIQKIPDSKTTRITVDDSDARRDIANLHASLTNLTNNAWTAVVNASKVGRNAGGTSFWRGGPTLVGERGPELVNLPRGSQVHTAGRSAAMVGGGIDERRLAREIVRAMREGLPVVQLPDAGRGAYLRGATI